MRIAGSGITHVVERHTVNGIARFAGERNGNGRYNSADLIKSRTQGRMAQQDNGNVARTRDAGRSTGIDRVTGQQTSVMKVITRPNGEVVSFF